MKNFKVMILALFAIGVLVLQNNVAFAGGIGFIDYKKIQENYSTAKDAAKEVDAKALELQQYLVDKEKEYKALDTPLKKKNFEDKTAKEFKAKQDVYMKFKSDKETSVYNQIQGAAKQVLVEQNLDAVVDYRVIFVGGIDITDLVLKKLSTGNK